MMLCMSRKHLGLMLCLWFPIAVGPAQAQRVTAVIERDVRVFAVVAALNAAGFDVELADQYHPVRQRVRDAVSGIDGDLIRRLREFYTGRKGDALDETQLAGYISLALSLTDPPALEFAYDRELIPPDARELEGFLPLLREFYDAARITQLWVGIGSTYDGALDRMAPPLREMILQTDAYLRVPLGQPGLRQLVIFVELAAPINSVNVRNYPDNLYIVLGDSTTARLEDVRHAYLHLLLDPIVARERAELGRERRLTSLIEGVPGVRSEYSEDFETLVTESLIRSVELRMDDPQPDHASDLARDPAPLIDRAYREGLLLVPHFQEELARFETSEVGIREFFSEMLESLNVEVELVRFEDRFDSITAIVDESPRAEVPPVPPVASPVPEILGRAQIAFNSGDDDRARAEFEQVLIEFDPSNGPALYGLALVLSRAGDPVLAAEYFNRTLESQSAEPSMRVWSHIYLGRIYDLQCEREAALEQYGLARDVGDDTQGAQTAAAGGIEQPFGPGCDF